MAESGEHTLNLSPDSLYVVSGHDLVSFKVDEEHILFCVIAEPYSDS
jgi:hypothetical protein